MIHDIITVVCDSNFLYSSQCGARGWRFGTFQLNAKFPLEIPKTFEASLVGLRDHKMPDLLNRSDSDIQLLSNSTYLWLVAQQEQLIGIVTMDAFM